MTILELQHRLHELAVKLGPEKVGKLNIYINDDDEDTTLKLIKVSLEMPFEYWAGNPKVQEEAAVIFTGSTFDEDE